MMGALYRPSRWIWGMLLVLLAGFVLSLYSQDRIFGGKLPALQGSSFRDAPADPLTAKALPLPERSAPVVLEKKNTESRDLIADLMAREKGEDVRALFAWLTQEFGQVTDLVAHMDAVRAWLFAQYDAESAEAILAVYASYIKSEMELADYLAIQAFPRTREARLAFWEDIRNFRIAYLGESHTEWLFGREMAESRYRMERVEIVSDPDMASSEKLQALEELDAAYRAEREDGPPVSGNAYQRYRELLDVHKRDLAHMASDAERQERIRALRLEALPADAVARMEAVEQRIEADRKRDEAYKSQRAEISRDTGLNAEAKEREVAALQTRYFGEDAESVRRRERIAAALQERMSSGAQKE